MPSGSKKHEYVALITQNNHFALMDHDMHACVVSFIHWFMYIVKLVKFYLVIYVCMHGTALR